MLIHKRYWGLHQIFTKPCYFLIMKKFCKRYLSTVAVLFLILPSQFVFAQIDYKSAFEKEMIENWDSFYTSSPTSFSHFYSLELKDSSEIQKFRTFFNTHKEVLNKKIKSRHSEKKKGQVIYNYLHKEVFKKYVLTVDIEDLITKNEYNCVTATSFFVDFAEAFNIPYKIFETPTHVYPVIYDGEKEIIVELTVPNKGFDFKSGLDLAISILLENELITQEELSQKGKKKIFSEYVEETKEIQKKELVAIQYFNNALVFADEGKFKQSLNSLRKAIKLYENKNFLTTYALILNSSEFDATLSPNDKLSILKSSFSLGKKDTLLTEVLLQNTILRIEELVDNVGDFEKPLSLLDSIKTHIVNDSLYFESINDLEFRYYQAKAENFSLKGNTKQALEELEKALAIKTTPRAMNLFVSLSSGYAMQLAQFGKFEEAINVISDLHLDHNSENVYPVITDTYVRVLMAYTMQKNITFENAEKLISNVKVALSLQPENVMVRTASAKVFHDLAMEQVRNSDYQKAKDFVTRGLALLKDDEMLKSDLKLIEDFIK